MQAQNVSRISKLQEVASRLSQDAKKLNASKTAAGMQKAFAEVEKDFKIVQEFVGQAIMNNDIPDTPRSTVEKPVEFVRKYLDRYPQLSRKEAIKRLQDKGVNAATARTQYHKWLKSRH